MPKSADLPSSDAQFGNHEARISVAERLRKTPVDLRKQFPLFSFGSDLEDDDESPPYPVIFPTSFDLLFPIVLVAPVGGDLIIDIKIDGDVARTLTIDDGDTYVQDSLPLFVPAGKILTAVCTATNGARKLTIMTIPRFT